MENREEMVEVQVPEISISAANTLKTMATIILVLGVIGEIFLFCAYIATKEMSLLITSIVSFFYIIITWSLMHVIANISLQLKVIQETMPLRLVSKNEINTKGKHSGIQVGDKVTWKKTMTKYIVAEISDKEVYLNTGLFGGYKWVPKDELIIPE